MSDEKSKLDLKKEKNEILFKMIFKVENFKKPFLVLFSASLL